MDVVRSYLFHADSSLVIADGSDSEDLKPTYGARMMKRLTGNFNGRIDYMLQVTMQNMLT